MWLTAFALLRRIASAVPFWAWALAAALGWGALQRHAATTAGNRAVKAERELSTLRLEAAQAAKDALTRLAINQQKAINEARNSAELERAGADAVADALRRLRARAAGRTCPAPAAAAGSTAAADTGDLPADVLSRIGEAAGEIAALADARGRAGRACERIAGEPVTKWRTRGTD